MPITPWLPRGFTLPNKGALREVVDADIDWQLYATSHKGGRALLARNTLAMRWQDVGLLPDGAALSIAFGRDTFHVVTSEPEHTLTRLALCPSPQSMTEALSFAASLRRTRATGLATSLHDALYLERYSVLLPSFSMSPALSDDVLLGSYLSGGVHVSCQSTRRLAAMLSWLPGPQLAKLIEVAGLTPAPESIVDDSPNAAMGLFVLPGRPDLESFFREHVIDIVQQRERYRTLGIDAPSAIVLHGPPGCGKTFAVERLVDFLAWPLFQVASGTVGSPFIHETGRKVAELFTTAIDNAPSVILIDEMESFLSDRAGDSGGGGHRVEEVAEFLRRIPEAVKSGVLIVGMTNRIDMVDPAILRRGRFDHIIEVGMPNRDDVHALLLGLLAKVPTAAGLDVEHAATQLAGQPLSDVAFAIREAGRLAARAGKDKLDQASLDAALATAPSRDTSDGSRPRIGFI